MKLKGYIIAVGVFLIVLAGVFYWGYRYYPLNNPCPQIARDTVYLRDTVYRTIPDKPPEYIVVRDSIVIRDTVFRDVDTLAILTDYYAIHYYTRTWEDSLVFITRQDAVAENKFIDSWLEYKIKRPQTVINNSVNEINYSRYIYGGLVLPINNFDYAGLQVNYAGPKGSVGVMYQPGVKNFSVIMELKLFKF